ncbi:unnamed protein product [Plasmodium vivax]|uniref:Leu/Phe-tRNA protein transferase, putative n=2 Tax=Plasmodium vivax TaxID=5855 RepID=A5KBZ3_PLAVS|nr:Leu/Phe-tRNA protein transferase, putative [Plasmodium vivax]EDL43189.1 Leu/Phe-tRNA protein transferase, putative [Plasmodium vivax]CAG9482519.1 unnamed protein product [Plasmodium vivax]CAI7718480.1 arginyl-tRNA--protein transferase, putative [Plasmodium vivax]|eukprot:XP_001612916.1 Leu/Phe-tRNA protein transferase [Plasmodium vivax Sal-1]
MSTCDSLGSSGAKVEGAGSEQKGECPAQEEHHGVVEAHQGGVEANEGEAHNGVVEAHQGGVEANQGDGEAHQGDVETNQGDVETNPGEAKPSHLDDDVNINRIIERLSKEDPESLAKIYSLMKNNNCLNFYPLLTPFHNIKKIVDILIAENYEHENTWCVHCDGLFICQLLYEGFIPVASKQKVCKLEHNQTKVVKECLLIPKIHYVRSCMHPSEIHISRKVKKKCRGYYITVDRDFDGVLQGIVEKHGQNWLYPFVQKEFKKIFEKKITYKNVRMHSVEVWCDDFLAAGEIGCTVGSIYTSLTGFQRKNSAGTIQLCALAKLLQHQQFDLWDLGMLLPYKKTIGSKEISMRDFFKMHRRFKHQSAHFRVPFQERLNCAVLITGAPEGGPEVGPEGGQEGGQEAGPEVRPEGHSE